jgi:4-diphosphocytidyl-2-C-methyl-D-erythritol kinase
VRLSVLAPGKVNLCLFLGPPRDEDRRHELVTVFESVSLADELALETLEDGGDEVVCPGIEDQNLVTGALSELRRCGWNAPPVRVEIDKRVPVAAGMGGGSADAAAMLRMASELAPGRPEEVFAIASGLGSDVPGQLVPGLGLGTGAGELVEPFAPLGEHAILVIPQSIALSTAEVYRAADELGLGRGTSELRERHDELLAVLVPGARLPRELLVNDLEPAAVTLCPEIEPALAAARRSGADQAMVCGSGPTVIGLFWGADGEDRAQAAATQLRGTYPAATAATPVQTDFAMPWPS